MFIFRMSICSRVNKEQRMNQALRNIQSAVVTGPTGAVGAALCRRLLAEGIRVYAVVRPGSARLTALPQSALLRAVPCDLAEMSRLPALLLPASADAFYHLAWQGTTGAARNDADAQLANVRYALDAARAAKTLGCQVFIGAGSQAEYGRAEGVLTADTPAFPENGYGMAKLCAGQLTRLECGRLGLAHIWVRILSVYGPYDGMQSMISSVTAKLLRGEKPALTAGNQLWDYLYADDAADALFRCAVSGKDRAVYPLGSGRAMPLRRYVEMLRDAIDPALPLGFGELPYAPRQVMHLEADIRLLAQDTGFVPRIPFEKGIQNTMDWMKTVL